MFNKGCRGLLWIHYLNCIQSQSLTFQQVKVYWWFRVLDNCIEYFCMEMMHLACMVHTLVDWYGSLILEHDCYCRKEASLQEHEALLWWRVLLCDGCQVNGKPWALPQCKSWTRNIMTRGLVHCVLHCNVLKSLLVYHSLWVIKPSVWCV